MRKTKSNALEICNKHELLKINLLISFWERTGVGGANKNVDFQIQIASQVSLCSVYGGEKKNWKSLAVFCGSQQNNAGLELKAAALAYTDCFILEQNV